MAEKTIIIDGQTLNIADLVSVARYRRSIILDSKTLPRIQAAAQLLREKIEKRELIYGVNTQFGGDVNKIQEDAADPENYLKNLRERQWRLIRAFRCGSGRELSREIVRGMMLLRANSLARGYSGVRIKIIERLLDFLNYGITPVIYEHGSVGASGDLIPLAYIASALAGASAVRVGNNLYANITKLGRTLPCLQLEPKEGLSLMNGTSGMTSIAAILLYDLAKLFSASLFTMAMVAECLHARLDSFEKIVQELKNHEGQSFVANRMYSILKESRLIRRGKDDIRENFIKEDLPLQDSYSIRCIPQGWGIFHSRLLEAQKIVTNEMNAVNDNPIIDVESGRVLCTGNFFGANIAEIMDVLRINIAYAGKWFHQLLERLVDENYSNGLPANLVKDPWNNCGFKSCQLHLADLAGKMAHLAAPHLTTSISTEKHNQDVISMGWASALSAKESVELFKISLSILLLAATQAADFRGPEKLSPLTRGLWEKVRNISSFLIEDRPMDDDIRLISKALVNEELP